TTYPGTTEEVLRPILEESGLRAGEDFYLAYSPEREDPGNVYYSTRTIPKVVGGIDATSLALASALYGAIVPTVVPVSSTRVAEALNEQAKPVKGSHVLILGVAYKKDVDDPRESPAFEIMELLRQGGAHVAYNDPFIPVLPAMRHHSIHLESQPLGAEMLAA